MTFKESIRFKCPFFNPIISALPSTVEKSNGVVPSTALKVRTRGMDSIPSLIFTSLPQLDNDEVSIKLTENYGENSKIDDDETAIESESRISPLRINSRS